MEVDGAQTALGWSHLARSEGDDIVVADLAVMAADGAKETGHSLEEGFSGAWETGRDHGDSTTGNRHNAPGDTSCHNVPEPQKNRPGWDQPAKPSRLAPGGGQWVARGGRWSRRRDADPPTGEEQG